MNQVFIINGSGTCGKDSFISAIMTDIKKNGDEILVLNYSSVTKVKEVAKLIGWKGEKTERDRKFLSDLKLLTTEYNDMPLEDMKEAVSAFYDFAPYTDKIVFLHIREPDEIDKAKKYFNAKTILVVRDEVEHITSNMADAGVYDYVYDIIIENNKDLDYLQNAIAPSFMDDYLQGNLKGLYN